MEFFLDYKLLAVTIGVICMHRFRQLIFFNLVISALSSTT